MSRADVSSRVELLCENVIEAAWLGALILAPLFFNSHSSRVFEPEKVSLVRALGLIAGCAWIVKWINVRHVHRRVRSTREDQRFLARPLVFPVIALAAAYLISTIFSVAPRTSWLGSYHRLQGTLSMFIYILFFGIVLDGLRTEAQWRRLQFTIMLTSFPIALYAVLQRIGLDPYMWWGVTYSKRSFATMGNPIFLAAYLIMVLPLTIAPLITALRSLVCDKQDRAPNALITLGLLVIFAVQVSAIVFAESRGPWLGLFAGIFVSILTALTALRRRGPLRVPDWASGVGAGVLSLIILVLGLAGLRRYPGTPGIILLSASCLFILAFYAIQLFKGRGGQWVRLSLLALAVLALPTILASDHLISTVSDLKEFPLIARLTETWHIERGTGRVRILIWQGVADLIGSQQPLVDSSGRTDRLHTIRPLIGYGPESMWLVYKRFYQPELAGLDKRTRDPDRSHNESFDNLVSMGAMGFVAYLFLMGSVFYHSLRWIGLIASSQDRNLFILLSAVLTLTGALLPWLYGAPYFAGIGVPLGLLGGFIIYASFVAFRGGSSIADLDRRKLEVLIILAALVSHFVELHFGIALGVTRTYFFILIAALVVLGTRKLTSEIEEQDQFLGGLPPDAPSPKLRLDTAPSAGLPGAELPFWRRVLPYSLITAIILVVLDWDFIYYQSGQTTAASLFWRSWTSSQVSRAVAVPWMLGVVLCTSIVGLLLTLGENWKKGHSSPGKPLAALVFIGITTGAWTVYGLVQGSRLTIPLSIASAEGVVDFLVNHITSFYCWLAVFLVFLAVSLWFTSTRLPRQWGPGAAVAMTIGVPLLFGSVFAINAFVIKPLRADIYFKLGEDAERRGDWQKALLNYDRAAQAAPSEDLYQLNLGRTLTGSASRMRDSEARQDILKKAEQVLLLAFQLSPLNSDCAAHLARYYVTRSEAEELAGARQQMLNKASNYYQKSVALSPNTGYLYKEWGRVYFLLGEYSLARRSFEKSLALDQTSDATYIGIAELERKEGNLGAALEAFIRAVQMNSINLTAWTGMAFILGQQGRYNESISAYMEAEKINPADLPTLRNLALLYEKTGDFSRALAYARRVYELLAEDKRPAFQEVIERLQKRLGKD